uniref:Retrovirus-related Pol polyprotein from transposon TNT 1-94 n=1 Tax=Chenopodium quinoa TaxID=63459 RepID=A0A803M5B1_CHEQI
MENGTQLTLLTPLLQPKWLNPNNRVSETGNLFQIKNLTNSVGRTIQFTRQKQPIFRPLPLPYSSFAFWKSMAFPHRWMAAAKVLATQTGGKAHLSSATTSGKEPPDKGVAKRGIMATSSATQLPPQTILTDFKNSPISGHGDKGSTNVEEREKGRTETRGGVFDSTKCFYREAGECLTLPSHKYPKPAPKLIDPPMTREPNSHLTRNSTAQITLFSSQSKEKIGLLCTKTPSPWIFDCGATDTITYDPSDISSPTHTNRTHIQTANGECVDVTQAGTVVISSSMHLKNCLLVPSLSHKLLSDAQTEAVIGRGTERGGLYYVDETTQHGKAMLTHGSPEHQLWTWHRRSLFIPGLRPAIATATYLTNRLPTKALDYQTPMDTLSSHVSIPYSHSLPPRVFGCVVYVHLPKRDRNKLEPRAVKCVFVGYGINQKGYRCFDPLHNRMYTTMDCDFFEHSYFYPQLSPQGETVVDDLSWLTYPVTMEEDPKEQVGQTTDVVPETIVSPIPSTPVLSDEHPNPKVILESRDILESHDIDNVTIDDPIPSDERPDRYELPPRSTRGVPPKRYDPKFEA